MSQILIVMMSVIVSLASCYSQYNEEQSFTFIYDGNDCDLINIAGVSVSISHNGLHMVFCNGDKQSYSIKQNISYDVNFVFNGNMLQLAINQHILYKQPCELTKYDLNQMINLGNTNDCNSKHLRHLLKSNNLESGDEFSNRLNISSTIDNITKSSITNEATSYKLKLQSTYEWYEIWKSEWWTDEWNTTKLITVTIILIVIFTFIICSFTCCIYYGYKKCKRKTQMIKNVKSPNQSNSNIITNKKYNKLITQIDTDIDMESENETTHKTIVLNSEQKRNIQNGKQSEEEIELIEHNQIIEEMNDGNNNMCKNIKDNSSEYNSEELFGECNETETPFQENVLIINDSTPTIMDKASIKSSIKAAEMTVGSVKSFSEQLINEIKDDSIHEFIEQDKEGFNWDSWLKNTLQQLFPQNWTSFLTHFKQQRITEDVLISLSSDKTNKSQIWKELIPIIGDRIRFQKAWNDELIRRQLCKRT